MPLPNPKPGEGKNFIGRCMKSDVMKKEFPNVKQRVAVCFSQLKRGNSRVQAIRKRRLNK